VEAVPNTIAERLAELLLVSGFTSGSGQDDSLAVADLVAVASLLSSHGSLLLRLELTRTTSAFLLTHVVQRITWWLGNQWTFAAGWRTSPTTAR
jgi:hypothetical protein